MLFRNLLLSVFVFGAVASVLPAISTELPKEGTCHVDSKLEGKLDLDKSSSVGSDGIESWDETHTTTINCGHIRWPAIKERHCFGLDEVSGALRLASGYCLDIDEDGDKVLWKIAPNKRGKNSAMSSDSAEVLLANGKYKGMSAKSTYRCGYGGSYAKWSGLCDGEMTFKFP